MGVAVAGEDREVFRFEKSPTEVVRAIVHPYRGEIYGNVRIFARDLAAGTLTQTERGITIRADLVPELERAVTALRAALDIDSSTPSDEE